MEIKVIKPGLYSSIQDEGRWGSASYGVPRSGAMDTYAARFANLLVRNRQEDAVLEITLTGPTLQFHAQTQIAITGLRGDLYLNQNPQPINQLINIHENDILEIKRVVNGCRLYLAVKGGFLTEKILSSRSMQKGITCKEKLAKNDRLPIGKASIHETPTHSSLKFAIGKYQSRQIEVYPGPEFQPLSATIKDKLFSQKFTLSPDCSRMAYLFKEPLENKLEEISTGPVLPGTVQLTPNGQLMILMKDGQVTGGYPRILQLKQESISILAQKKPGDAIGFKLKEL